ncbi:hypothetical protein PNOK_0881000 [Pyrrhoderma noxium]|uniref:Uncharacterized protein n=1 Tax=Pyrrhoderma noxium TaxID=2282107 RepID=A0A286U8P6_9AGAM|nr:hypothetical protein PNOK_0881000 [Pyrrhoderma noxium]
MPEVLSSLLKVFSAAQTISKSIQICTATIFFLYCVSHINDEIVYIWKMPWTVGKGVYLLARYSGALFLVTVITLDSPILWEEIGHPLDEGEPFIVKAKGQCLGGYFFVAAGSVIILLTEVMMTMRVYALYGQRKWVVILSSVLMIISFFANQGFTASYFITPVDSCISKPCISSEFDIPFQMVASCTLASRTISFFGWVSTFIVESLFLFLIIRRTRQLKKMSGDYSLVNDGAMARGGGITSVMARDSKKYFLMIFIVFFIATCSTVFLLLVTLVSNRVTVISLFVPAAQGNTALTVVIATITILAPKLFLNIRIEYYGPIGPLTEDGSAPRGDLEESIDLSPGLKSNRTGGVNCT